MANSSFERSSSNSDQERNCQHAQPQHNRSRSSAVEKGDGGSLVKKINKFSKQRKSRQGPTSTDYRAAQRELSHVASFDKRIKAKGHEGHQQTEQHDS